MAKTTTTRLTTTTSIRHSRATRACLVLAVCCAAAVAGADDRVAGDVTISGVADLTADEARQAAGVVPGAPITSTTAAEAAQGLLDAYADRARPFARASAHIEGLTPTSDRIVIDVQEGAVARVGSVQWSGLRWISVEDAGHISGLREADSYDAARWERGVGLLSTAYAEAGYPLARIAVRLVNADEEDGRLALHIAVDEGPRVTFEDVTFEGASKTRRALLRRMVRIAPGDVYDSRRVAGARQRLLNSGLFTSLHPADVLRGSADGSVVYRARLEEARTARFLGVLGYAPPTTLEDAPQVTGIIEAVETNILGTGREARLRWESGENRTNQFAYREPFLFGRRVAWELEWDAERYQGSRTRSARSSLTWELTSRITAEAGVQAVAAEESSGRGGIASLAHDTRDFRPNPSNGALLRVDLDTVAGDISFTRAVTEASLYLPVGGQHVVATRATAGAIGGPRIPFTEWLFMGGATTLRGYEERQFRGTRRVTGALEYRILTGRLSHVFAFVDVGRVSDPDGASPVKLGYGLGANLESRGGLIRFQYGIEPSGSPLDGKVHLSLGTTL
jgi:outer membrane protein insertion porin family